MVVLNCSWFKSFSIFQIDLFFIAITVFPTVSTILGKKIPTLNWQDIKYCKRFVSTGIGFTLDFCIFWPSVQEDYATTNRHLGTKGLKIMGCK